MNNCTSEKHALIINKKKFDINVLTRLKIKAQTDVPYVKKYFEKTRISYGSTKIKEVKDGDKSIYYTLYENELYYYSKYSNNDLTDIFISIFVIIVFPIVKLPDLGNAITLQLHTFLHVSNVFLTII